MDVAVNLAKNVVNVRYEDLPPEAIEVTKRDILDVIGSGLAGTSAEGSKELFEMITHWGGIEESTILLFGNKVPTLNAAMVNAAMARALELDSYHDTTAHGSVSVFPAAYALAEKKGNVSGKALITAVALGVDVMIRLGLAPHSWLGWSRAALHGYFGAAAAAGKILNLDEGKMVNTLGLAYSLAAGDNQSSVDGALSKRLSSGFAAKGGVFAALLAQSGITGAENCLEGKFGLYPMFERGEYDRERIIADLGRKFMVTTTCFKPYPSCGLTHGAIDAALSAVREYDIAADDVEEVSITVGTMAYGVVCDPIDIKQKPESPVNAQFSAPYTVAAAIVGRKLNLDDFTDEAIKRTQILQLTKKVKTTMDSEMDFSAAKVEIKMKSGKEYSKRVDIAKGRPDNPMTTEEFNSKFWDCVGHAVKPLPRVNIEKVIELVNGLEDVNDVSSIMKLLVAT